MPKSSVYLNRNHYEAVLDVAARKGVPRATVVAEILDAFGLGKDDVRPVMLQIPKSLLAGDRSGLHQWLGTRSQGILNYFYPSGT